MNTVKRLLLVVNPDVIHIGGHLKQAAEDLNIGFRLCDSMQAFYAPYFLKQFNWRFLGHRPVCLGNFSQRVLSICKEFQPKLLISTGLAPIEAGVLAKIGELGIKRINYLTDDPFNNVHKAMWFMKGLVFYDYIFSPRRSNIEELEKIGCQKVTYLPFAYNPHVHYPEPPSTAEERLKFDADIVFIGGADTDRIPYISALIKAGFKIGLYGTYWDRFLKTRTHNRGYADCQVLRKAISSAKIALCLVRRANRDGHSMRSFEVPAIGACMLTEDTAEHREIFGKDDENVVYFKDSNEMIRKAKFLIENNIERKRLADSAHALILKGRHTYKDRLITMLES